jgi:hypothetical protein
LDLSLKKENWQWTQQNLKGYWIGLHQKQLKKSFIGFKDFYHCFIKGFSHLAHPLHDLLKKVKKFVWSEECQESFDQLKE